MRITMRAGGLFANRLPAHRQGDTAELDLEEGSTPADLLDRLELPRDGHYLIILNDSVVPRAQWDQAILSDNDHLSVMPPLKGG